jgi:nitric oxide reductase subunit B
VSEPRQLNGWDYASRTLFRGAIASLGIALVTGLVSVIYSVPSVGTAMREAGIAFANFRPVHTLFAAAWIFLGGLAVVHHCVASRSIPLDNGYRWRLRVQMVAWAIAGIGVLCTLPFGIGSGREYMGAHPLLSIPIAVGWIAFTWNYFRVFGRGFFSQPVYVTMWGVACIFFLVTFTEQHFWLLVEVFTDPLVDRRIQWKATGTLIGSFNLLVYGSLIYVGERLTGDNRYGHSRMAYGLFAVGLLNSFTNFAHHTYHLPQSHTVKWISFVISMTELLILFRVLQEILACLKGRWKTTASPMRGLWVSVKFWTGAMLFGSLLISVPMLNTLIHGTTVVAGHAMGTMIGIDSLALIAALVWICSAVPGEYERGAITKINGAGFRRAILGTNWGAGLLVGWLTLSGVINGVYRYGSDPTTPSKAWQPEWLAMLHGPLFAVSGILLFVALGSVTLTLGGAAFSRFTRVPGSESSSTQAG